MSGCFREQPEKGKFDWRLLGISRVLPCIVQKDRSCLQRKMTDKLHIIDCNLFNSYHIYLTKTDKYKSYCWFWVASWESYIFLHCCSRDITRLIDINLRGTYNQLKFSHLKEKCMSQKCGNGPRRALIGSGCGQIYPMITMVTTLTGHTWSNLSFIIWNDNSPGDVLYWDITRIISVGVEIKLPLP